MTTTPALRGPIRQREPTDGEGKEVGRNRARARLEDYAKAWKERPLTRRIYRRYYRMIAAARSRVAGADLEVGAGHGGFAEFKPKTISCDIVPCGWLDCAADATCLPFADESLSNIIMIDVRHHVASPAAFFDEARRTLAPGGRIILLEPYVSPVSWIAWKLFCEEAVDTGANPFADATAGANTDRKDPWEANVAIPTLICWRHLSAFHDRFPELEVIRRERFDMLVMPLSGGYQKRRLIPMPLVPIAHAIERVLAPLAPLLAFRCLVVIEKGRRRRSSIE